MTRRNQRPRNPEELMRMLHALSGDQRYLKHITFMEEGGKKMCDLLDEMVEKGLRLGRETGERQGRKKGRREGRREGIAEGIKALVITCRELGVSFEETACKIKLRFRLSEKETKQSMKLYWRE